MTSFIFPGQGSQYVGMAKDFHDSFLLAKQSFEEIEDYSNINIRDIIFNNSNNTLDTTKYTQICIFAVSYVIFEIFSKETNLDESKINVMMGHSLGEYTALACSNKISLKECALILKKRGELMNNAAPPNKTGMAALIGKDSNYVQKIINEHNLNVEIANDNSPIQIVISGSIKDINHSENIFLENNIKRFIKLNVSAAFHSKFMLGAQKELSFDIEKLDFLENNINIISNFDANISKSNLLIKKNLLNQMANRVQWSKSIKKLEEIGETDIYEIGPNKILSGLIKRISGNFNIISINEIADIK